MQRPQFFLMLVILLTPASLWAQGTIFLSNRDSRTGLDAPIYYPDGTSRISYNLRVEVLAGRDPGNLATVLPMVPMEENGYWRPQTLTLDSMAPGETAYVQVRAFWEGFGMSYDRAVAERLLHGSFDILPIVLGGDTGGGTHPPTLPASLTGLRPLVTSGVPEPSTVRLLLLGSVVAVWARRRAR